jgi:HlyD family secretion protein
MATVESTFTAHPPHRTLTEVIEQERVRRQRRRLLWWVVPIAIPAAAMAVWLAARPRPVPFAARFRTQPVSQGNILREVRATGHVEAVTTVQVGAEISGRIASVNVDYNTRVRAGQVLASLDRTTLAAQLAQMQATLLASRAALEQVRTDRARTDADLARAERLHAAQILSDADFENTSAAARLNQQRVTAAEAQVAAQQQADAVARTNLEHTLIRSPIDGIVITRNIDPGQTVASALQTPVLFTVAADLRKMQVVAATDEADVGEIATGQSATFTVDAYPDRVFAGTVTSVRNSPVVVQDVVTYGAVIQVENTDLALKPGMTASVHVRTAAASQVLRVPNTALSFAPPGEPAREGAAVWVSENGALRRVPVRPGVTDGELTAIANGPLAAGAKVVVDLTADGRKAYATSR